MPVFKLKIALENAPFKIERTVLIAEDVNFLQLHFIIQDAMGWFDGHLFEFSDRKGRNSRFIIGLEEEEPIFGGCQTQLANEAMLSYIYETHSDLKGFRYWYDFGDDWWHKITYQKITKKDEVLLQKMKRDKVICYMLKATGACPPEDCGGVWGYLELLEALNDPDHPEHAEYRKWLGLEDDEKYDYETVNVDEFNKQLGRIHKTKHWNKTVDDLYDVM